MCCLCKKACKYTKKLYNSVFCRKKVTNCNSHRQNDLKIICSAMRVPLTPSEQAYSPLRRPFPDHSFLTGTMISGRSKVLPASGPSGGRETVRRQAFLEIQQEKAIFGADEKNNTDVDNLPGGICRKRKHSPEYHRAGRTPERDGHLPGRTSDVQRRTGLGHIC